MVTELFERIKQAEELARKEIETANAKKQDILRNASTQIDEWQAAADKKVSEAVKALSANNEVKSGDTKCVAISVSAEKKNSAEKLIITEFNKRFVI